MKLTWPAIEAQVRYLASHNPDGVYKNYVDEAGEEFGCMYVHPDGSQGCIFGVALTNLGVSANVLAQYDEADIATVLDELDVNDPNRMWANIVQAIQDNGTPWGEAVTRADVDTAVR